MWQVWGSQSHISLMDCLQFLYDFIADIIEHNRPVEVSNINTFITITMRNTISVSNNNKLWNDMKIFFCRKCRLLQYIRSDMRHTKNIIKLDCPFPGFFSQCSPYQITSISTSVQRFGLENGTHRQTKFIFAFIILECFLKDTAGWRVNDFLKQNINTHFIWYCILQQSYE